MCTIVCILNFRIFVMLCLIDFCFVLFFTFFFFLLICIFCFVFVYWHASIKVISIFVFFCDIFVFHAWMACVGWGFCIVVLTRQLRMRMKMEWNERNELGIVDCGLYACVCVFLCVFLCCLFARCVCCRVYAFFFFNSCSVDCCPRLGVFT